MRGSCRICLDGLKAPLLMELEVTAYSLAHSLTGSQTSSMESCPHLSCPPAYQADTSRPFKDITDFSVESFMYAFRFVYV